VIHHRDGDTTNNDITNLACTTQARHAGFHASRRRRARRRYADLGPKFSDREVAVIRLLHARPALTAHLIAKNLGLGLYTVVQVLRALHEKNVVLCEVRSNCGKTRWSVSPDRELT
jgi:transcription initiation factor IIE alpha subunit